MSSFAYSSVSQCLAPFFDFTPETIPFQQLNEMYHKDAEFKKLVDELRSKETRETITKHFHAQLNREDENYVLKLDPKIKEALVLRLSQAIEPYLIEGGTPGGKGYFNQLASWLMTTPAFSDALENAVKHSGPIIRLPEAQSPKRTLLEAIDLASLRIEGQVRNQKGDLAREFSKYLKRQSWGKSVEKGGVEL